VDQQARILGLQPAGLNRRLCARSFSAGPSLSHRRALQVFLFRLQSAVLERGKHPVFSLPRRARSICPRLVCQFRRGSFTMWHLCNRKELCSLFSFSS
jgi:hypothetical protein